MMTNSYLENDVCSIIDYFVFYMSTRSRLGHNVCSIIDNFIFHDLHKNVIQELIHVTSDIYYITLVTRYDDFNNDNDNDNNTTSIIFCMSCNYYWTWTAPDDVRWCRHCFCKIPKGVDIDNKTFNPYLFQNK